MAGSLAYSMWQWPKAWKVFGSDLFSECHDVVNGRLSCPGSASHLEWLQFLSAPRMAPASWWSAHQARLPTLPFTLHSCVGCPCHVPSKWDTFQGWDDTISNYLGTATINQEGPGQSNMWLARPLTKPTSALVLRCSVLCQPPVYSWWSLSYSESKPNNKTRQPA